MKKKKQRERERQRGREGDKSNKSGHVTAAVFNGQLMEKAPRERGQVEVCAGRTHSRLYLEIR